MQGNVFALVQIFNAIPSPSFSAPAELRMILIRIRLDAGKNRLEAERARLLEEESEAGNRVGFDSLGQNQRVFEAFSLILPRRPTGSDSLEGRFRKAGLGWVGIFNVAPTFPCPSITILFPVTLGKNQKLNVSTISYKDRE
jgi:hypothetical protein